MNGHGWVTPNPDGSKARCGGPALCSSCALEAAQNQHRPKLLSPADTAKLIGRTDRTLRSWAAEGKGPRFVLVEGRRMYRPEDIDAWVNGLSPTPTPDSDQ